MKKSLMLRFWLLLASSTVLTTANQGSPVGKALELLTTLQQTIIAQGEEATKTYNEVAELCEDRSRNLGNEIKSGKAEMGDLKASIEAEAAAQASLQAKVEELAAAIQTAEGELKSATEVRKKEAADFTDQEKNLMTAIDVLERSSNILENEAEKADGGASMLQLKNADSITHVMGMLVEASALTMADANQLTSLIQGAQQAASDDSEDEGDGSLSAPDAAQYENHGKAIVNTMYDLLDKAQTQLSEARKKESESLHSYELVKQSLDDELKFTNAELTEAKQKIAASSEKKAVAEGDLEVTAKELKEDTKALGELRHDCMSEAQDYEIATTDRGELLKALAGAKKWVKEKTGAAEKLTYDLNQVSFMQVNTGAHSASLRAIRIVRELARKEKSQALAQLSIRMAAVARTSQKSAEGADPFVKVKNLITDMIDRLEQEADEEANHKAFCDKETAENKEKKEDRQEKIEKLSTKIDQMTSRDAELKAQIMRLQKELSALIHTQAQMDQVRQREKADYKKNKADMEVGIQGVKMAMKLLRDYYAQGTAVGQSSGGSGNSLIGILEVTESDFSKNLAEMTAVEEAAQSAYDNESHENKMVKTAKEEDVKHKSQEVANLEKLLAEASNDKTMEEAELDAILESLKLVEKQCATPVMSHEERQKRFQDEVTGLKEALSELDGEPALIQQSQKHALRGGVKNHQA